jgi:hypothetical protein
MGIIKSSGAGKDKSSHSEAKHHVSEHRLVKNAATLGATLALVMTLGAAPAAAQQQQAEPNVSDLSWYWKDAHTEQFNTPAGMVSLDTPNPFCPGPPAAIGAPQDTCAESRLPVWVRGGDYEEPYMISAVGFDLTLIPLGSEVHSFTATFLEDKSDCEERDDAHTDRSCWQTDPINAQDKELQACMVGDIIAGGEARPYEELPDHRCVPGDPVADREESEIGDGVEPRFEWTFDLTAFAQQWVEEMAAATAIMIAPHEPEEPEGTHSNWRVVLAGPTVEDGVRTELVFTPGEDPFEEFDDPGTFDDPGAFEDPGEFDDPGTFGGAGDTGGFDDSGGLDDAGDFVDAPAAEAEAGEVADPDQRPIDQTGVALGETSPAQFPAYAYLALLAALIAFSLVRSVVLERAAGIRPDGAIAQIRKLNAQRRGVKLEDALPAAPGPMAAFARGLGTAGEKAAGVVHRLAELVRRR